MYWYPFAEEEEEKAVAQAQAQAEAVGRNKDDLRKFVGNLGELAVEQFFGQFVADQCWEYLNAEAIDNAEPEYSRSDFRIMGMDVDIKSTTDIRKFDPIRMSRRDANWPSTTGYPEVDFEDHSDVYVFVLISKGEDPTPYWRERGNKDSSAAIERQQKCSGNQVAAILGWLFAEEAEGEFAGNMNMSLGKFTRMSVRDMYELLLRSGVALA